ncbi:hypothetical protein [Chengkuizengella marina]|uniref:Uncharacterized protein n=1 Tax=Chengkuizengella marina TaxID=2507566 RepID=A0A6N9Q2V7_9BACL|nr:hypothetical protein [Chengkuizengella marina]NBI29120.1 hypothetical protein [Chengkuizengella marina]
MKEYLVTFKNAKEMIISGSFFLFDETIPTNNNSGENNNLNAREVLCVTEVQSSNSVQVGRDDLMVVKKNIGHLQTTKDSEITDPEARQKQLWPHLSNLKKD